MKLLAYLIAATAAVMTLTHCGGGSSGDDAPATVRPKTLDGIVLSLDTNATIEFIRNSGTSPAVYNGDVETGTFIYTAAASYNTIRAYDNLSGDQSNFRYPASVSTASYTYRAINDTSGELTLTGTGTIGTTYTGGSGGTIINDSWIRLFVSTSPQTNVSGSKVAKVIISFTSTGTFVTSDVVTLSLPESSFVSTLDTVRIPTAIKLATGGSVPENYNPVIDPLAPSKIAPESLSGLLLVATNGTPDPTKDYTLQFVADASGISGNPSNRPDEVGQVTLRVYDTSVPSILEAVTSAANYTWTRTGGTDKGVLVLSGIPDVGSLPFDLSINGTYTMEFLGTQNGKYTGTVDGDTLDAAEVTGTFITR
jgi:hypothetical protein